MKKALLLSFTAVLLAGVACAQTNTDDKPSLADLAAKQKKTKSAPKKVITNEDLPEHPADSAQSGTISSASTASGVAGTAGTADAKADSTKSDPKDKKAPDPEAVTAAKAKVDGLKHDEDVYTDSIKRNEELMAKGSEFRRNMMAETIQHQKDNLEATKAKRQAAEAELDKLNNPPK
ncbi:MAG: hypothetical protein JWO13_2871 [Acidobacteriales bacterium]|nr:hypothetical protein [Terriglobales bacterium]